MRTLVPCWFCLPVFLWDASLHRGCLGFGNFGLKESVHLIFIWSVDQVYGIYDQIRIWSRLSSGL
jgi:hypothetical protein